MSRHPDSPDSMESPFNSLQSNPIGQLEEYAISQDWNVDRTNESELWLEIPGLWGGNRVWISFHDNSHFLQINSYLNFKVPKRFRASTAEGITLINERIWLGHFEIWSEESVPVFRVVVPLRGATLSQGQLEDLMLSVTQETDRFYPVFQWIIWGGKEPQEAVTAAMIDTEGEA